MLPSEAEEGNGSYRTRFIDGCEIPCACWELNYLSNPKCWRLLKSIYIAFQLSTKHFCWYIRLGVSLLGMFLSHPIYSVLHPILFLISSYMFRFHKRKYPSCYSGGILSVIIAPLSPPSCIWNLTVSLQTLYLRLSTLYTWITTKTTGFDCSLFPCCFFQQQSAKFSQSGI